MGLDRVPKLRQAVCDTLMNTGKFKNGTPYYRRNIGPCPTFMVFWDGKNAGSPQRSAGSDLVETTHRLQIEVYSLMSSSEEESTDRFDELVAVAEEALRQNHRLDGACIRSRVVQGQADMWMDKSGSVTHMQYTMFLEADCPNW